MQTAWFHTKLNGRSFRKLLAVILVPLRGTPTWHLLTQAAHVQYESLICRIILRNPQMAEKIKDLYDCMGIQVRDSRR